MPTFYFDLRDDIGFQDMEGRELPDVFAAMLAADREARQMICACVQERRAIDIRHKIEVRDAAGEIVTTVRFEDAIRIVGVDRA